MSVNNYCTVNVTVHKQQINKMENVGHKKEREKKKRSEGKKRRQKDRKRERDSRRCAFDNDH